MRSICYLLSVMRRAHCPPHVGLCKTRSPMPTPQLAPSRGYSTWNGSKGLFFVGTVLPGDMASCPYSLSGNELCNPVRGSGGNICQFLVEGGIGLGDP